MEGYNVFNGSVDVVVCDGFTGNSILKIAEAMKKFFISTLRDAFSNNPLQTKLKIMISYAFSILGIYTRKKKMITQKILPMYYGAAPLLGVNGTVLIGHGTCSTKELINAIELAYKLHKIDYLGKVISYIKKNGKKRLTNVFG